MTVEQRIKGYENYVVTIEGNYGDSCYFEGNANEVPQELLEELVVDYVVYDIVERIDIFIS